MAVRSRFTRSTGQAPAGRKLSSLKIRDMRGLNSTDPYGILQNSASPYLRNARMYLSESERQVAISTRQGTGKYTVPIGEALAYSQLSTANADELTIGKIDYVAQKFTATANASLSKVKINIKKNSGNSPVYVQIYSDNSGEPSQLLATSSILNLQIGANFGYVECSFIEAPELINTNDYWLVLSVPEGDNDTYIVSTTDNTTDALISENAGNQWAPANVSINYEVYTSTSGAVLGHTRFYPTSGVPVTFFAHKTDIYSVNDSNGTTTSRKSGLNTNATRYRFAQFDGAVFVANGYNALQRSTGAAFADVTDTATIPSNVVSHKNRLWVVSATDPNRLEFSELADYTDWEATGFIYVPEPKSPDLITGLVSFQDNLVVFTQNNKYVIYGDDLLNFTVRQSLGQKGAVSQEAICADENYIYFVSSDGHTYRWGGSEDEQISRQIEGDLDDVANFKEVRLAYNHDRVHYYFQPTNDSFWRRAFVYETRYNEWFYDADQWVNGGTTLARENDNFILQASNIGVLYYGNIGYSDIGKPIDFEYHTNYFDFDNSDNFKQVRRLYLQFRKTNWPGTITVGADTDFKDDPYFEKVSVQAEGAVWGQFIWGQFVWGSNDQYFRHRMTIPGQATHYQVRVLKSGVNTPLYFIGYSMYYRNRRAA
jgi:hypothetical protein